MLRPLDGPSRQLVISVDAITPKIFKKDTLALDERKVITIQLLEVGSKIWIYFADEEETPTAGDISSKGFLHYGRTKESYEAANTQVVWILAESGTVNVRGAERA